MAGDLTIIVEQGATFNISLVWVTGSTTVNTSGFTAKLTAMDSNGAVIVTLSNANSRITLGTTTTLTINATDTASLLVGDYLYDLFFTSPSGTATRLLAGTFSVIARITT